MGLACVDGVVTAPFLDRTYRVSADSIELSTEKPTWQLTGPRAEEQEYNIKSVVGYYVLSDYAGEPGTDFRQISSFSHGVFREDGVFAQRAGAAFKEDYHKFEKTVSRLGMTYVGSRHDGQFSWDYRMFPKLPLRFVWYEGDEDFPSAIQVLFDPSAVQVFVFETLAVLHGCLLSGLGALAAQE
jgi:hypothetical protein